jgi:tetratricopeptide (TPR) repeat protein
MQPTAFISYSWDNLNEWHEQNELWVKVLADRLVRDNVKVSLDKWAVQPGDSIPQFMEKAITENDKVLIICTPRYKYSSDNRKGAVGYESHIISSLIFQSSDHRKFITIIKQGDEMTSVPTGLIGKYHVFLDNPCTYEKHYQILIDAIHGRWQNGAVSPFTKIGEKDIESLKVTATLNLSFALLQTLTKQQMKTYINHYKKMVQANSYNAAGWFGLGLCTLHYASYDAAIMQLKKAISLDSFNADYYYYLAIALCKGKSIHKLSGDTIKDVHDNISKAIAINDEQAKYYVLILAFYFESLDVMVSIDKNITTIQLLEKIIIKYKDSDEIRRMITMLQVKNNEFFIMLKSILHTY